MAEVDAFYHFKAENIKINMKQKRKKKQFIRYKLVCIYSFSL